MSGIYINGMKMPEKSICVEIFADGSVHEFADPWVIGIAGSVPDHGRLVDADALVKRICGENWMNKVLTVSKEELRTALTNLPIVINNAPTIIPADKGSDM